MHRFVSDGGRQWRHLPRGWRQPEVDSYLLPEEIIVCRESAGCFVPHNGRRASLTEGLSPNLTPVRVTVSPAAARAGETDVMDGSTPNVNVICPTDLVSPPDCNDIG